MIREELMQVAKPILFNTEMVRAILDGRKTQTRRVIKPQPKMILSYAFAGSGCGKWGYPDKNAYQYWGDKYKRTAELAPDDEKRMWKPPYHTDDILYVRETWCKNKNYDEFYYRANRGRNINAPYGLKWRPSIHMPKEAARIFLKVTNVRVERLQDMSEYDAESEGYKGCPREHTIYYTDGGADMCLNADSECPFGYWYCNHSVPEGFGIDIWNTTIKKEERDLYGWDANPWVWVIEFERVVEE